MTKQGRSRNDYACYGGIVVAGPGIDVACPIVDMNMIHLCSTLRDCFRDEDVVLEEV